MVENGVDFSSFVKNLPLYYYSQSIRKIEIENRKYIYMFIEGSSCNWAMFSTNYGVSRISIKYCSQGTNIMAKEWIDRLLMECDAHQ